MTEERSQAYVREQVASYAGQIERSGLPRAAAGREGRPEHAEDAHGWLRLGLPSSWWPTSRRA